eukprot:GHVR01052194.1.p1 GENE.GHVR01052194.1~~GHVR01052194.1.p1  ORF type:complete len:215 (+),score=-4.43 GHVR01052194.1:59-646(+)
MRQKKKKIIVCYFVFLFYYSVSRISDKIFSMLTKLEAGFNCSSIESTQFENFEFSGGFPPPKEHRTNSFNCLPSHKPFQKASCTPASFVSILNRPKSQSIASAFPFLPWTIFCTLRSLWATPLAYARLHCCTREIRQLMAKDFQFSSRTFRAGSGSYRGSTQYVSAIRGVRMMGAQYYYSHLLFLKTSASSIRRS